MVDIPVNPPTTKTEDIPGTNVEEYTFPEGDFSETITLTGTVPARKTWKVIVKIVTIEE